MSAWSIFKVALRALSRNMLRSALTMLGIIIGVGAVIAMVSVGQGAQVMVQQQVNSMGSNVLFIMPGNLTFGGASLGAGSINTLTEQDVAAVKGEVASVAAASPLVRSSGQIVFGNENWFVQIQGTNEEFLQIRNWPLQTGEFFSESQVRAASKVIVLGKTVADKLFPGIDPVGQTVRVRNLSFRVIGILAGKGQGMGGQDQDDTAIMPFTTVQKKLTGRTILSINQAMISTVDANASKVAEQQIRELLRQRHRLGASESDDFQIRNMSELAEASTQMTTIMTMLLGSIAAISLVVGGIGIMNIMLVSVSERTHEIGIRMAVGARPSYVRLQFLTESLVLSLAGGLLGIVAGAGASTLISSSLNWPTVVSAASVATSFGFAAAIGVFFGYYPAHKAASLDPIDALRYE